MNDLFAAIVSRFRDVRGADSAYSLTGGRMYRGRAKKKSDYPYIVVHAIGGTILGIFGEEQIEQARMQFNIVDIFDGNAKRAGTIWESLVSTFERQPLALLDGIHIVMRREGLPRETIDESVVEIIGDFLLEQHTS